MSNSADQISEDIKTAMRAKDSVALNSLRALKSAITNAAIEKGGLGTVLDEPEIIAVVRKQIKQRQDSIEQFEKPTARSSPKPKRPRSPSFPNTSPPP